MSNRQIHFRPPTGECLSISREISGFDHVSFQVLRLDACQTFSSETGVNELGIVVLGGICSAESSAGEWRRIGGRAGVFHGVAYTLYLPIETRFNLIAETACEFALCYCAARKPYPARLIPPGDV